MCAWGGPSSKLIGWMGDVDSVDGNADFEIFYRTAKEPGFAAPAEWRELRFRMVRGLFAQYYPGYMDENVAALSSLGLDVDRLPISSVASVATNAAAIRDLVLEQTGDGRSVVLIAQSKGAVDVAAALGLHPEIVPHVRAFVAIQTPFAGSPIATDLESKDVLGGLPALTVDALEHLLRVEPAALQDMRHVARRQFLSKHAFRCPVPTVSLATTMSGVESILSASNGYIEACYSQRSDGLVCPQDAVLPGSTVVRLAGLDHAATVLAFPRDPSSTREIVPLTRALVAQAMALEPPPPAPAGS